MNNTNPTSENSGITEGTYNVVDNIHSKTQQRELKKKHQVLAKDNQFL
jgi:hypothetical protein